MNEENVIILVQGHKCLYNLQHKDYEKYLVKDNCWKEIAEIHTKYMEQATGYLVHCRKSY